jgi:hypothetical protein
MHIKTNFGQQPFMFDIDSIINVGSFASFLIFPTN